MNTSQRVGVASKQECVRHNDYGSLNRSFIFVRLLKVRGILCILNESSQPTIQFKLILMIFLRRRLEYSINSKKFLRLRQQSLQNKFYLHTFLCRISHYTFLFEPIFHLRCSSNFSVLCFV